LAIKRPQFEEIVAKLQKVEAPTGQGLPRIDAIRQIGVTEQTYHRWKKNGAIESAIGPSNNGDWRNGHGTTQGTEAVTEREWAPAPCGF
jgi:hypothetical protein